MCWTVLLTLSGSFLFSGVGFDLGPHFSRGHNGAGLGRVFDSARVLAAIDFSVMEGREEEAPREKLASSFIKRFIPLIRDPYICYFESSYLAEVNHLPDSYPLLI